MAKDKTHLLRLLFIDKKIRQGMRSGTLANCSSMAEEYEVSSKSIMRDIDYLKNQRDAPIAYDARQRGYYYTEDNYALPALSLNESDLFAICIAEKALKEHEKTPVYQKLKTVFRKIEEALPEKVSVQPDWVEERISVIADPQANLDSAVWDIVAQGLHNNKSLQILYQNPKGKKASERMVDPYHVVRYQGEWYLIGYCHLRQGRRTFALSRIRSAELTNQGFEVPDDFDPSQAGKGFGIFKGSRDFIVRILFSPAHAPYVRERQWHPDQELKSGKGGEVVLSFPTSHLYEVKRWVLSWGSGVKALEPPELVTEIKAELRATLTGYQA